MLLSFPLYPHIKVMSNMLGHVQRYPVCCSTPGPEIRVSRDSFSLNFDYEALPTCCFTKAINLSVISNRTGWTTTDVCDSGTNLTEIILSSSRSSRTAFRKLIVRLSAFRSPRKILQVLSCLGSWILMTVPPETIWRLVIDILNDWKQQIKMIFTCRRNGRPIY